ncbi:MAG: hypothetical protein B7Z80_26835, partial [Rhodospirillales bacterium 20-64-7]
VKVAIAAVAAMAASCARMRRVFFCMTRPRLDFFTAAIRGSEMFIGDNGMKFCGSGRLQSIRLEQCTR